MTQNCENSLILYNHCCQQLNKVGFTEVDQKFTANLTQTDNKQEIFFYKCQNVLLYLYVAY